MHGFDIGTRILQRGLISIKILKKHRIMSFISSGNPNAEKSRVMEYLCTMSSIVFADSGRCYRHSKLSAEGRCPRQEAVREHSLCKNDI